MSKEEAKQKIIGLIDKFNAQIDYYKSVSYNETQTRSDFVDAFFAALGWDLDNKKGKFETQRDVIQEYSLRANGRKQKPDYCFKTNGKSQFFVEAKKPAISIKDNPEPALQLRSYGWNAKLSISVLTDFEEFAIYDCTRKKRKNDTALSKRLKYIYYTDYVKEFDFIWNTFAYENVANESIDKFAKTKIDFKEAEPVDKEFLLSLNDWREELATNIANNDRNLSEEDINFSVQQIIDRIVFLRVCEDRNIEPEEQLLKIAKASGNTYQTLFSIFQTANQKYNSGLFDFSKDKTTKNVSIDNKVIKYIINNLYERDYNFAIIPVEILGYAYEQFLGKVIRLTAVNHAVIEEKPEVRKAGGVYYTPDYIVNYIVAQTLGKLIEGKTPQEVSQIRVLDPSCGSGSFLLGAYQFLLDWHLKYYLENTYKGKNKKENPLTEDGKQLTSQEKKRILLNNIYGVDIDTQAVEVSKLSLLLKALEGETEASIQTSLQIFNERVLPTIDGNIQCGNSLIAPDFYNDGLFLTPKEERKINVFDWKEAFPDAFKNGGFDCVIGNPPYVFTRDVDFGERIKQYYKTNYLNLFIKSANTRENQIGKINLFALFIIQGFNLLNPKGTLSCIIPNTLLRTTIYEGVRKFLLDNTSISRIIDLKAGVFDGVTAATIILQVAKANDNSTIEIIDNPLKELSIFDKGIFISKEAFYQNPSYSFNIFVGNDETIFFNKIRSKSVDLSEIVNVYNGIATYKNMEGIYDKQINNSCKKILMGKDIGRYFHKWHEKYVEYIPKKLQRARDEQIFTANEKLIMQRIGGILITSYDNEQYYTFNSVNNLLSKQTDYNLKYVLGILNSKFMIYYYIKNFTNKSALTVNISKTYLDKLPIPAIDFSNKLQKNQHDQLVKLVNAMLELKKRLQSASLQTDKDQLNRRINSTEKEIDKLVYQLYGITEAADIEVIEGKNA